MIGNAMQNLAKMVWSRELIEHGIKNKKIVEKSTPAPPTKKTTIAKKKERDVHVVFANQQFRRQASYASQSSFSASHLPLVQQLSYNNTPTTPSAQVNNYGNNRRAQPNQEKA